jgi:cytochrome b subunit of formate dehydrogenase
MLKTKNLSSQTRNNWFIDLGLFISAVLAALSGIYFLFLPVNGYQGGRNPMYGINILFDRHTWGDLHNWAGLVMVIIACIHLIIHWKWVVSMTRRIIFELRGKAGKMSGKGKLNLGINTIVALSFLICGISGLYFFFIPGAAHDSSLSDPIWLFTRTTWDLLHTWSGVVLISATILHFAIHWIWIKKVTLNLLRSISNPIGTRDVKQSV